jgi:hypothetical protein
MVYGSIVVTKLYSYVGPARIRDEARHQPKGAEIRTLDALHSFLRTHGGRRGRESTVTFVIDEAGVLRIADRHSEHVACADEMAFAVAGGACRSRAPRTSRPVSAPNRSPGPRCSAPSMRSGSGIPEGCSHARLTFWRVGATWGFPYALLHALHPL